MIRAVLICFITACANTEMSSIQQSVYVSRKSRSNSAPHETGFVYSKVDHQPGTLAMYNNDAGLYKPYPYNHGMSDEFPTVDASKYDSSFHGNGLLTVGVHPSSNYDIDYEKSKAEAKYDSHFYPSKMESDAEYEKLKSVMHYKFPDSAADVNYNGHDYHNDDDDVRSSSRTSYDGWPYFYHNPYEYEAIKMDSDLKKAKDKRFITSISKHVIPVHEHVDDIPRNYVATIAPSKYGREKTTDNPLLGNQPFFSFVLSDYFDTKSDDDPLSFKGLDWGKDFDHESFSNPDDYSKRDRRLESQSTTKEDYFNGKTSKYDTSKEKIDESATEKGYNKINEFDKHEHGDGRKENHKASHKQYGDNYKGFKNFIDTFANKFGGEDHKKDSKYILKQNQDKGENRKGFRRVYHKDEYQEDNEFYDNTNNTANSEEKGTSALHNGGSEAFLQSQAAAALGNDSEAYSKAGNAESNNFENNHHGHNINKGNDNEFNRYRDVAKTAARSNNADYIDHYRPS